MQKSCQYSLLKYQRIQNVSYGSTSYVYKIKRRQGQSKFLNKSQTTTTKFEQFPMANFDNEQKQKYSQKMQDTNHTLLTENNNPEPFKIFKSYNIGKLTDGHGHFIEEVKYNILAQVLLLKYLKHPGIVNSHSLYCQYSKSNNGSQKLSVIGIVMQNCQKGTFPSLLRYIDRTKILKDNKVKIIKFYLAQIANVLIHLNKNCKILHRDIKAENILITKSLDIKLADFGTATLTQQMLKHFSQDPYSDMVNRVLNIASSDFAKQQENKNKLKQIQQKRKNLIGSRHYISPQLIQKYKCDIDMIQGTYDKTDVWSFGVLVYKIFHDKFPFQGRNLRQTTQMIQNQDLDPVVDPQLPAEVKQMITKILVKDHQKRISWGQVQKLRFFKDVNLSQIYDVQSPIITLFRQNKQEKSKQTSGQQKYADVVFNQKMMVYDQTNKFKKRKILIVKPLNAKTKKKGNHSSTYFFIILKENQSISIEVPLDTSKIKFRHIQAQRERDAKSKIELTIFEDDSPRPTVFKLMADKQILENLNQVIFQYINKE